MSNNLQNLEGLPPLPPSFTEKHSKAIKIVSIAVCITIILAVGALVSAHLGYLQKGLTYSSQVYHAQVKPWFQQMGVQIQQVGMTPIPIWMIPTACLGSSFVGMGTAFGGYWIHLKRLEKNAKAIQIEI